MLTKDLIMFVIKMLPNTPIKKEATMQYWFDTGIYVL
jgi:hypothetical protein